ncbi:RING finger domain protein [Aspergillus sclerotialis]|uniref:RING-type E3 ubiquitin transferase n=1 Tax=Aspergillus sclerotialis TaxID=2070753 RepID=A0A3A2ZFV8_9EURO|nr:RING finger domain protein [Aspergillus sclerotialis]
MILLSSFFSPPLLLLLFLLTSSLALPAVSNVVPSNSTADLSWIGRKRFNLQSSQIHLPSNNIVLLPLTEALVNLSSDQLAAFNATGDLVLVDATNSVSLASSDLALISCDRSAYPGLLDATETFTYVVTASEKPAAIVLYTTVGRHCNYLSSDDHSSSPFPNVFTLVNPHLADSIESQLTSDGQKASATILADKMSFVSATTPQSPGGEKADSPNTAMIILYSITGIITALFLGIIITGAVRAHRHPERYGPRYAAGRPRQSRARGIARAMLETIPIVKFGDANDGQPDVVKGDVELGTDLEDSGPEHSPERQQTNTQETTGKPTEEQKHSKTDTSEDKPTSAPPSDPSPDSGNFSCPICTDDFVKGQDIRLLPCNHQFHPDCIDPWLVNVSGTCPLCRIDLNPPQADEDEEGEAENDAETPQDGHAEQSTGDGQQNRQHRRFGDYLHGTLNARRMRDASVEERLAALRGMREVNRENAEEESAEEAQGRRRRLTSRLRERFRIRTRAHESADSAE